MEQHLAWGRSARQTIAALSVERMPITAE